MRQATCRAFMLGTLFALSPALAAAQVTTIFQEGFESGLGGWGSSGTFSEWHLEPDTTPCGLEAAPFPVGNAGARWGSPAGCTFGEGPGHLTRGAPISIPVGMGPVTLKVISYDETECGTCEYDRRLIYVSVDGGFIWDQVGESAELWWHETVVDLSAYAGLDIKLRFTFDATDIFGNDGLGWLIDDVRIDVGEEICEPPLNFCSTTQNSSMRFAEMTHSGSTSLAANDFVIGAKDCPYNKPGMMFYGPTQANIPYGDGTLCSGAGGLGYFRIKPVLNTGPLGIVETPLDYSIGVLGSGGGQVTAGSTWNFQFWFRDPLGGPEGFSFSDGLEVHFCP
jgi:hypothetical protein